MKDGKFRGEGMGYTDIREAAEAKAAEDVTSAKIAERLKREALDRRDFCQMKLKELDQERKHWSNELDVISAFLEQNHLGTTPDSRDVY